MPNKRQERENKLAREYFKSLSYEQQLQIQTALRKPSPNEGPGAKAIRKIAREVLSDA